MVNKILYTVFILCVSLASAGSAIELQAPELGWKLISWGVNLAYLVGIVFLIMNGDLRKSFYLIFILFSIMVLMAGILFTIMHWPYGHILVEFGLLGIPVVYTIKFMTQKIKNRQSFLRWLWVVVTVLVKLLVFEHMISVMYGWISILLLGITVIDFYNTERKSSAYL